MSIRLRRKGAFQFLLYPGIGNGRETGDNVRI